MAAKEHPTINVGDLYWALEAFGGEWGNLNCPERVSLVACQRRGRAVAQLKIGDRVVWEVDSHGHEVLDPGLTGEKWENVEEFRKRWRENRDRH